jgi:5-methylcytosine-specific restriction enzyme A
MLIRDLSAPVTASKADWLPGTSWLGFTPVDDSLSSRNQCQSTVQRQFGNGYVIEYVTEQFNDPNPGFENDAGYLAERQAHKELAGRLIAVHKLRTSGRSLENILGAADFKRLQDMWAQGGKRFRWSVAFPIVESYRIKGTPKAKEVLGEDAYRRLYQRSSATLRALNDNEREKIALLELEPLASTNAWIGIEDEFKLAEASEINPTTTKLIEQDLLGAMEGMVEERKAMAKRRAAWLADKFIRQRVRMGQLTCDECRFDPSTVFDPKEVKVLRSLLDVHHKHPLEEGVRYTTTADFALLCPTCHRVEHTRIRAQKKMAS